MFRTVLDTIRTRFGTVLTVERVDQASVRALLTLHWDTGHHVLAFEETTV